MAITKIMNENEENIRNATIDGISGDAVGATLEDVIKKSNSVSKTPMQVKDTVEAIVEMKSDVEIKSDEQFASDLVKENNEKIKSAINEGITANEVVNTLVKSTEVASTKKGRKSLKFLVNLISKMKKKEIKLNKRNTNEKGYQKVLDK